MDRNITSVAETYGLVRAADLPSRPKPPDDHRKLRERWAPEKKHAFKTLAPRALCVVASDGPVSVTAYAPGGEVTKRFGHNRGCWPVRLASTGAWADTVSRH